MKLTKLECRFIDEVRRSGHLYGEDNEFALSYVLNWQDDPAVVAGLKRAFKSLIYKGALLPSRYYTIDDDNKEQPLYTVAPEATEAFRNSRYMLDREFAGY